MYYISESASLRLIAHSQPTCYHSKPDCWGFKNGAKVIPLDEKDRLTYAKYLKPCKACAAGAQTDDDHAYHVPVIPIKKNGHNVAAQLYPCPETITIWKCSDGRDFSDEKDALRYELDLMRARLTSKQRGSE